MSWSLFLPVILAGILYGAISIAAGIVSSRGDEERAERVRDYGFVVLMAVSAWTVILLIISIFNKPNSVWDMVVITLVIVVFFALLLIAFFAISLVFGALGRMTSRRRQVTTEDL
jgi:Na+-driven multidrug efflux pump